MIIAFVLLNEMTDLLQASIYLMFPSVIGVINGKHFSRGRAAKRRTSGLTVELQL